jgi:DNA invertase Pin-like site-specific DNA recombinase
MSPRELTSHQPNSRNPWGKKTAPTDTAVKKCAVYTRISPTGRDEIEFSSLDAQREAGEHYVRSQAASGWQLLPTRYEDEYFTGGNADRPAVKRLFEDIERGRVNVVVVSKVDRISRSLSDFTRMMEVFEKHDVAFVSVTQNFDTSTPMGRLVLNILMSFAEFERGMISERTRDKIVASRRHGKWTGGAVPFGYRVVEKKLVPEMETAGLVRRIFELYLELGSTSALAFRLNRERGAVPEAEKPWTKDRLSRILKNPVYAGFIATQGELCEGEHEAIVERTLFEKAKARLLARRTVFDRKHDPDYVLRSLIRCECGYAIVPATTHKAGHKYRYYRCSIHDNPDRQHCRTPQMSAGAFEKFVGEELAWLTKRTHLGDVLTRNLDKYSAGLRTRCAEIPRLIGEKSGKAVEVSTALNGLRGAARRGPEAALEKLGESLRELEEELDQAERELYAIDGKILVEAKWLEKGLAEPSKWPEMPPKDRARLFRGILKEIVVTSQGERLELHLQEWIVRSQRPTREGGDS